jgi:hypothetical protein
MMTISRKKALPSYSSVPAQGQCAKFDVVMCAEMANRVEYL